jgi:hypothetical protein
VATWFLSNGHDSTSRKVLSHLIAAVDSGIHGAGCLPPRSNPICWCTNQRPTCIFPTHLAQTTEPHAPAAARAGEQADCPTRYPILNKGGEEGVRGQGTAGAMARPTGEFIGAVQRPEASPGMAPVMDPPWQRWRSRGSSGRPWSSRWGSSRAVRDGFWRRRAAPPTDAHGGGNLLLSPFSWFAQILYGSRRGRDSLYTPRGSQDGRANRRLVVEFVTESVGRGARGFRGSRWQ